MVFLTAQLWLRNRVTDRYWRVQEVLKHARHFRGRKNRCYRLAVRAVTRAFVQCTRARRLKKRNLRMMHAELPQPGFPCSAQISRCAWSGRRCLASLAFLEVPASSPPGLHLPEASTWTLATPGAVSAPEYLAHLCILLQRLKMCVELMLYSRHLDKEHQLLLTVVCTSA
ncbi:large ribosomal subunit protein bL20m isoform X1 [Eschrichtius robustus]|uniref:large ribosomal subunit protein bL20m isoform X1 n=1 Tax=Eschrichtius robustus TaxID=9764 RepID=UPI0035BF0D74